MTAGTPPFDGDFANAESALLGAARAAAGLQDFGDRNEYLPGLRTLLRALHEEAVFTPMGAQVAFGALVGPLAARLHAVEGWRRRPDCLTRPVRAPLLILGMPRTGTTALYHLLWHDPQFQGPEMWLIDAPMPRPPPDTWSANPAHRYCAASIAALLAAAPGFAVAHPRDPDLPDECLDILKQCYANNLWGTMFPVPSYDAWWPQQDHARQYRYLYRVLQLIGADDTRRWLLKDPTSILHLPELLQTFPDVSLIVTHRDPAEVIASLCSLLRALHTLLLGGKADMARVAEREIALWSRGANLLAQRPECDDRCVHVPMHELQAKPMRVVRRLYDRFGLELSAEAERAMLAHLARTQSTPRQAHRYAPDEFGLDVRGIRRRFAPYIARFLPQLAEG